MNRKRLTILFAVVALVGALGNSTLAQTPTKAETQASAGSVASSQAEQELAANSKRAIIETGISEPYFKEHFRLLKVVNEAGDRRVEWKYSVN